MKITKLFQKKWAWVGIIYLVLHFALSNKVHAYLPPPAKLKPCLTLNNFILGFLWLGIFVPLTFIVVSKFLRARVLAKILVTLPLALVIFELVLITLLLLIEKFEGVMPTMLLNFAYNTDLLPFIGICFN